MTLQEFESMFITISQQGDTTIATFRQSRLSEETNIEQLGHELFSLVEQHHCRKLVLDLGSLEYATSAVLGKFISLHRKLHRDGGRLCLCRLTHPMQEIFRTSRLLSYFEVVDTLDEAVATLAQTASDA